jgi:hypothetical protein
MLLIHQSGTRAPGSRHGLGRRRVGCLPSARRASSVRAERSRAASCTFIRTTATSISRLAALYSEVRTYARRRRWYSAGSRSVLLGP